MNTPLPMALLQVAEMEQSKNFGDMLCVYCAVCTLLLEDRIDIPCMELRPVDCLQDNTCRLES